MTNCSSKWDPNGKSLASNDALTMPNMVLKRREKNIGEMDGDFFMGCITQQAFWFLSEEGTLW
jgi:hypothetical protein